MTMMKKWTSVKKVFLSPIALTSQTPSLGSSHSEEEEDDMEEDYQYIDDTRLPSPKGKHRRYEVAYESLSVDAIEEIVRKEADHIVGIFGVDVCFLYIMTDLS